MAAPAEIDTTCLSCADTFTTQKGAKQIPLANADGSAVVWQPKAPLNVLWEPSAFNDPTATRLNITFSATPEVEHELHGFDEWSVNTLALESSRLFGQQLSVEELRRRYQPALRVHEQTGAKSLRCKMNTQGRTAVKCWDTFRQPRSLPDSWQQCTVTARIAFKGFWIMAKECGPLLELQHALLDEAPTDCPF